MEERRRSIGGTGGELRDSTLFGARLPCRQPVRFVVVHQEELGTDLFPAWIAISTYRPVKLFAHRRLLAAHDPGVSIPGVV